MRALLAPDLMETSALFRALKERLRAAQASIYDARDHRMRQRALEEALAIATELELRGTQGRLF